VRAYVTKKTYIIHWSFFDLRAAAVSRAGAAVVVANELADDVSDEGGAPPWAAVTQPRMVGTTNGATMPNGPWAFSNASKLDWFVDRQADIHNSSCLDEHGVRGAK
jgi:hypothetical protein